MNDRMQQNPFVPRQAAPQEPGSDPSEPPAPAAPRPEIPTGAPRPEIPAKPSQPEIPAKPSRDLPQPDRERAENEGMISHPENVPGTFASLR